MREGHKFEVMACLLGLLAGLFLWQAHSRRAGPLPADNDPISDLLAARRDAPERPAVLPNDPAFDPAPVTQREIDARAERLEAQAVQRRRQQHMDDLVAYAVREPMAVRLALEWRLREDWAVACGGERASVALVVTDQGLVKKVVWAYCLLEDVLEVGR